jgi:tetratricopeptide (TPR) repeat protein
MVVQKPMEISRGNAHNGANAITDKGSNMYFTTFRVSFSAGLGLAGLFWLTAFCVPAAKAQVSTSAKNVAVDSRPGLTNADASAPRAVLTPETLGDIAMARKNYRQAIADYQEVQPSTAVLMNKTGIAYHQLLELDLAKKYYEKSVKANPNYAEAVNNLGTVYYARKNYRRAMSQYKRALKLDSSAATFYSNLGTVYFARKEYTEAFDSWRHAVALDPDVFEHRNGNGVILQEKNVEERAKFHYYMAKMYANSGATARALQYLRMSLEEGLKERSKLAEEPEFASLRELPEFQELLTLQPHVL